MSVENSKYRNPPLPLRPFPQNRRIETVDAARNNIFNHGERIFAVAVLNYLDRMNYHMEMYHEPHPIYRPDIAPENMYGQRFKTLPDFLLVSWDEEDAYRYLYVEVTVSPQFPKDITKDVLSHQFELAPADKLSQKLVMEEADEPYVQVFNERLLRYTRRMDAEGIEYTYTGEVPRAFITSLRKYLPVAIEQRAPELIPLSMRRWLTRGELNGEIELLPEDIRTLIEELWAFAPTNIAYLPEHDN